MGTTYIWAGSEVLSLMDAADRRRRWAKMVQTSEQLAERIWESWLETSAVLDGSAEFTVDANKLDCRMIYAGVPSFLGLGLEDWPS